MEDEVDRKNELFVATEIVFFAIVGGFGNVNLMIIVIKKKELWSKSSYLTILLSASHLFCLLAELQNAIYLFLNIHVRRDQCYSRLAIYLFVISWQAALMLMIVVDMCIIVFFHAFYKTTDTKIYLTIILTPPIVYGLFIAIGGYFNTNDDVLEYCNPPLAITKDFRRVWTQSNVVINTMTLLLFFVLLVYYYSHRKNVHTRDTRKIVKRLKVSILFFVCTWYLGLLAGEIVEFLNFPDDVKAVVHGNLITPVLLSYTQTFYIIIWRSVEFRKTFFELWSCLPGVKKLLKKKNVVMKVSPGTVS